MFQGEIYLDSGVSQRVKDSISTSFERILLPDDVHTPLCKIMRSEKSDKAWAPVGKHNYTQFYYELLQQDCDSLQNFLEIGLGTNNIDVPSNMGVNGTPGASLRGWRRFFPNADVYGGDVDKRVLFQEDRIETFFLDQLNTEVIEDALQSLRANLFDVILDDGLHRFDANKNFHQAAETYVKPGGFFIIEDINCTPENVEKFKKYFDSIERPVAYMNFPHFREIPDNSLAIIEY